MDKDPQLKNAVAVVSVHYPRIDGKLTTPPAAFHLGKPLWSSEDQPASSASKILSRDWNIGGRLLAQLYNENYLKGGFTATEIWSPVTSYYDILAAPNSGLMYANTPWSGHYDVQGAIWATAHTTQFAQPGWQYLDRSSGYLPEHGDYVSLRSADARNWSVILETIDAIHPQQVHFKLAGGLRGDTVHIWETNAKRTFEHVADVPVQNGLFAYTFDPDSLYSLTTTTGQGKGSARPPTQSPFPFPYREDFEKVPLDGMPHYLSDQDGAFQVEQCVDRAGRCLEQVITRKPTPWGPLPDPWTLAGDSHWTDYEIEADVHFEGPGDITLMGRINSADIFKDKKARYPSGYVFVIDELGAWKLLSCAYNKPNSILAVGKVNLSVVKWHRFGLSFLQGKITLLLDGHVLSTVQNNDHRAGMFGVGTDWNRAQFDELTVKRP
jgi:galactosylceramidase